MVPTTVSAGDLNPHVAAIGLSDWLALALVAVEVCGEDGERRSRWDLLIGLLDGLVEDIAGDADTEPSGVFPGSFSALAVFRHVAANAHIFKALIGNGGIDLVERAALDLLTERASSVLDPSDGSGIPDDIRAAFLAGSLMALVAWWVENDLSHPPETMANAFNEMTSLK